MKPNKKSEILDFLKSNKDSINAYGVKRIGLFGSFVRNSQREESDIDILVEFYQEQLSYSNFINLAYFLEDNLERKVDLLTTDGLSPYIGPRILEEVEYVSL
jgi:predicted nucleotidyltransferase